MSVNYGRRRKKALWKASFPKRLAMVEIVSLPPSKSLAFLVQAGVFTGLYSHVQSVSFNPF
jgi:hypothetical protein